MTRLVTFYREVGVNITDVDQVRTAPCGQCHYDVLLDHEGKLKPHSSRNGFLVAVCGDYQAPDICCGSWSVANSEYSQVA
jgi:hypothetical protein